jgi:hypothetical protein
MLQVWLRVYKEQEKLGNFAAEEDFQFWNNAISI